MTVLSTTLLVLTIVAAALWFAPRWLLPLIAGRSPRCLYAVPTRSTSSR